MVKMMQPRRREYEGDDEFFPRLQRNVTNCMSKHGFWAWDVRAREFYFKWAGSVSRMSNLDKSRITPKVMRFLNIASIRDFARRNKGDQGHGRRLHVWRWESDIFEYAEGINNDWEVLASRCSEEWFGVHLEAFRIQKVVRDNLKLRGHKRARELD